MFIREMENIRLFSRSAIGLALIIGWQGPALAVNYLGSAASFAVLGASAVTNTGASVINGDIGVSPSAAITGAGTIVHTGAYHAADPVALMAQSDAANAAAMLSALAVDTDLTGLDLGSLGPLAPGVYRFASSAQLTGTLTLDYGSDPTADFVFLIGSTLTTATNAAVVVLNGSGSSGLFWNVGTGATLGTGSAFAGNILAQTAITFDPGASIYCGRAISLTTAVTLIANTISNNCGNIGKVASGINDFGSRGFMGEALAAPAPEPGSWALMIAGFGLIGAMMRRRVALQAA